MPTLNEFKQGKRFGTDWNAPTFQGMNEVYQTAVDASNLTLPPDNSQANNVGNARVEVAADGRLKFIEIKGNQGIQGNPGANAIILWGINAQSPLSTVKWRMA